jgi:hypothetical protein
VNTHVSPHLQIDKEQEREIKEKLQKEVNLLIYQKRNENITMVKEVSDKETRRLRKKNKNKDTVFTSSHHMAAEATVRKFKAFLYEQRRMHTGSSWDQNRTQVDGGGAAVGPELFNNN